MMVNEVTESGPYTQAFQSLISDGVSKEAKILLQNLDDSWNPLSG